MDGSVGEIGGCDAILCAKGFYSSRGRQVSRQSPCIPCGSLIVSPFLGQTKCDDVSERKILQNIFYQTGGNGWLRKTGWNTDAPLCSWDGIACHGNESSDSGIRTIDLSFNNLVGTLPPESFVLPFLVEINASGNSQLQISFEAVATELPNLELINLAGTKIRSINGVANAVHLKKLVISGMSGKCNVVSFYPDKKVRDSHQLLQFLFTHRTIPLRAFQYGDFVRMP
jgi:hypothetical protein